MSDLLAPFHATVDPSLITSASSFFDNSIASVVRELLQNSRRSGATEAHLSQTGNTWTYHDNGPGCEPRALLGLGTSRWTESVLAVESPAGCGFFSLARRNPRVTCPSLGWTVDLTEEHFNGRLPIAPAAFEPVLGDPRGLVLEFDKDAGFSYGLGDIAKYMPIDFFLNGSRQTSHLDFLGKPSGSIAHRMVKFSDEIEIRVDLVPGISGTANACYHGLVVEMADRDYQSFGTIGESYAIRGAVQVASERALPLELPQRNKMVKSATTAEIKDVIFRTGLELAVEALSDKCLASPTIWLSARITRGYTGPIFYPKFIGRLVTRHGLAEMDTYDVDVDDDGEVTDYGRYITIDEFEAGDYLVAPSNDILSLIAQTTLPATFDEQGNFSAYTIDTDEFFAPGLRLVETLDSLGGLSRRTNLDEEGAEWINRVIDLRHDRSSWNDIVTIKASGSAEGKSLALEEDIDRHNAFDDENLYDDIFLEFGPEDGPVISLRTAALFDMRGDSGDMGVNFIITRKWLESMPGSFPTDLSYEIYKLRKCDRRDSDEEVTADKIDENIRAKLALFQGLDEFYCARILDAAITATEAATHHLPNRPRKVVVDMELSDNGHYALRYRSSCVLVPKFVPYYTFEGSHGTVACDEQGQRDPRSFVVGESGQVDETRPAYPEFDSFDVETMNQYGLQSGDHDIQDACGWRDSTRMIYLPPAIPHLMWKLGLCKEPLVPDDDVLVRAALLQLLREQKVSVTLNAALWKFFDGYAGLCHREAAPAYREIYVYDKAMEPPNTPPNVQ